MITLRVFVIFALVLNTAQLSHNNWKNEFVNILKTLLAAFPIPYNANIDLICSGKDARVWFQASGTLDKDKEVLNGLDPAINNIEFSINVTNFKFPIRGKYTCEISFQTYTSKDLLLLNLTGSNLDITQFLDSSFMKMVYLSFFKRSEGITYNKRWTLNPSSATRTDNPQRKDYKINSVYPIINKLAQAVLQYPKSLMSKLFNSGSLKDKILGFRKPDKSSKQEHIENNGDDYLNKEADTKGHFRGNNNNLISGIRTKYVGENTDVHPSIKGKNEHSRPNFRGSHGSKPTDVKVKGRQMKPASAVLSNSEKENKSDKTQNNYETIAAAIAVALFSVGVVGFTSSVIIGFLIYHKYVKIRKCPHDMETGLSNGSTQPHKSLTRARSGPGGIRLTACRTRGRINSAPVTSQVSNTPEVQTFAVQPKETVIVEIDRVASRTRLASEIINRDSLPEPSTNNKCSLQVSESTPDIRNSQKPSQLMKSDSAENILSYSHIFHGKHLHTMRKVSTDTDLPHQNNEHDIKATLIHVKPIDTQY